MGDDGGCFYSAVVAVRKYGGVIEHPADSNAWRVHGFNRPDSTGKWIFADGMGAYTCCVEQGHYGHISRKKTWLYLYNHGRAIPPDLIWGKSEQRIHPTALAKHGYEKARRIGMMAMIGGKDKTKIRNATPVAFRDLLIDLARQCALDALKKAQEGVDGK